MKVRGSGKRSGRGEATPEAAVSLDPERSPPAPARNAGPAEKRRHIRLSSHPGRTAKPIPLIWGAADPGTRGPVLGSVRHGSRRNAIGAHAGSYVLYRALAVAAGRLDPVHVPGFDGHRPRRARRAVSRMVRRRTDRLPRPVGTPRERGVRAPDPGRVRHPADHRDHPRAPHRAGGPKRHRSRPRSRRTGKCSPGRAKRG